MSKRSDEVWAKWQVDRCLWFAWTDAVPEDSNEISSDVRKAYLKGAGMLPDIVADD